MNWGLIYLSHIRFRKGLKAQGIDYHSLPFYNRASPWGQYFGLFLIFVFLAAELYFALFPFGGSPTAEGFFSTYLSVPLFILDYVGYKVSRCVQIVLEVSTRGRVAMLMVFRSTVVVQNQGRQAEGNGLHAGVLLRRGGSEGEGGGGGEPVAEAAVVHAGLEGDDWMKERRARGENSGRGGVVGRYTRCKAKRITESTSNSNVRMFGFVQRDQERAFVSEHRVPEYLSPVIARVSRPRHQVPLWL